MSNTALSNMILDQMGTEARADRRNSRRLSDDIMQWLAHTSDQNATSALTTVLLSPPSDVQLESQVAHAVLVGMIGRSRSGMPLWLSQEMLDRFQHCHQQNGDRPGFQSLLLRCLYRSQPG